MAGDINLFFNSKLDGAGENPTLERTFLAELIELKESRDLCDVWRIRTTKTKGFTFTQQHSSGFIQCRLDYIFISNGFQEFVSTTNILTPFSTDYSPVLFQMKNVVLEVRLLEI